MVFHCNFQRVQPRSISQFSRLLIGRKEERYIVEEVIEVDELDEGKISAAAEKQDK